MNHPSRESTHSVALLTPRWSVLWLTSCGLLLCFGALYWPPARQVWPFLALFGGAFLFYMGAVREVVRHPRVCRKQLLFILSASVCFHGLLWGLPPLFDDDLHRYAWEGKLVVAGENPYLHPPNDLEMIQYWKLRQYTIPYDEVPSVYPPLSQAVFALASLLAPDSWPLLKALFASIQLAAIGTVLLLLRRLRRPQTWILVFAWSPLALKETANSGHMDSLVVLGLVILALSMLDDRPVLAGLSWAASVLSKLVPLVFAPLLWFRLSRSHQALLIAATVCLVAYLPFSDAGLRVFDGLKLYGEYWVFNPGLFSVVRGGFGWFLELSGGAVGATPTDLARIFAGSGVVLIGVLTAWKARHRDEEALIRALFWPLAALLMLGPTVDPWYLLWLLPWLCVYPSPSFILWTGLVFLSYGYYFENRDLLWIRGIEYGLVWGSILWEWRRCSEPSASAGLFAWGQRRAHGDALGARDRGNRSH